MDNRAKILKFLKTRKQVKTSDLVEELGVSRQKVSKHLSSLVKEGILAKDGSTRNSRYHLSHGRITLPKSTPLLLTKKLKGLAEDKVFGEVELRLATMRRLPNNVGNIAFYAFGEMLNNAIDHSGSMNAKIEVQVDEENFSFKIKDLGVGIFANIQKKFKLNDEHEALEHVLKGKQTTLPDRHSGQGIFFTSRIADVFKIKSHKIELTIDNFTHDFRVKSINGTKGTEVFFQIKKRSRKVLRELFAKFANDDYEFDRTAVRIKLTAERELLARSQARRILSGLDRYKAVTLDFQKVKEVGQGFIDEIFRVFKERNPTIQLLYINANPAVEFMIQRQRKV